MISKMKTENIISVFIVVFMCIMRYGGVTAQKECLDVTYCYLVGGDICRESEKFGKDPTKLYEESAKTFKLYMDHIHGRGDSTEECKRLATECRDDATKLAIEGLGFPSQYQTECDYRSFSRTVFDCKNIKHWPQKVKDVLPKEFLDCKIQCIITEDNEMKLTSGKIVNTKHMGALPSGDLEVDDDADEMGMESRVRNRWLETKIVYSGLTEDRSNQDWGKFDQCSPYTWVNMVDHVTRGDYLYYVAMACTAFSPTSSQSTVIESTPVGKKPENQEWSADYAKQWGPRCNNQTAFPGNPHNSFVVGVSLHMEEYKTFGKVLKHVNYVCGNNETTTWHTLAPPDTKEMMCPNGMAVCAIKTKSAKFENQKVLVDLEIHCCRGHGDGNQGFLQKSSTDGK